MPELPEVETIRRDLERRIVGKKIKAVEVRDKKVISFSSVILSEAKDPFSFGSFLRGQKFAKIERRGKLLAFLVAGEKYLLVHLKMTGQLIYKEKGVRNKEKMIAGGHKISEYDLQVPNKFTRAIFIFADKSQLFFNDMRRFGYMKIVDKKEKERIWREDFGIEPLTKDFKFQDFARLFKNRKTNIKALLLNQKLISGIGNIYADEACFCAGLLPWRKVASLKSIEIKKLFQCISQVLRVAIKNRGTSFSDFVDATGGQGGHYNFLKVYERAGNKCRRCGSIINKIRHAGRGTHYCPECQK